MKPLFTVVGFISVGKVFGKAFRILGLNERYRWVVEYDFHENFQDNIYVVFFVFSSGLLDQIVLILVQFETSLHPAVHS